MGIRFTFSSNVARSNEAITGSNSKAFWKNAEGKKENRHERYICTSGASCLWKKNFN
jgi:hypothetical protein